MKQTPEQGDKPKLTLKQQAFICAYLQNGFNATKAAKTAGYSDESAYSTGAKNLTKAVIAAEISRRLDSEGITPEKIKVRMAEIAFGGDVSEMEAYLDGTSTLAEMKADGVKTQLIKSVSCKTSTSVSAKGNEYTIENRKVDMYSSLEALDKLARVYAMFQDKVQHSGQLDILTILKEKHGGATDDRLARAARTAGSDDAGSTDGPVGDS